MLRCAFALLLTTSSVEAQDNHADTIEQLMEAIEEVSIASETIALWGIRESEADREKVISILSASGYSVDFNEEWVSSSDKFTLYSTATSPGNIGFLVVPDAFGAKPVSFTPLNTIMDATIIAADYSPDSIADRILDGMQRSIAAVCRIGAQPETITGKASAIGIVEIEATWRGSEICDAIQ